MIKADPGKVSFALHVKFDSFPGGHQDKDKPCNTFLKDEQLPVMQLCKLLLRQKKLMVRVQF